VYSVLLLLHVGCALVGFGALVLTGVQAARARRGPEGPDADAVRRYFRPGINWAGRALYGVPAFGLALVASSGGAFSTGDGFVLDGLLLWSVATVVAEGVVWPGERRIQVAVSERWADPTAAAALGRDCRRVIAAAALLGVVFVTATALMVARP
jgi:uncharacterized membrane protein